MPRVSVDLHLHSSCSDGRLTPEALVAHVAAHGVRLLALTDHDTVAGLPAATSAAQALGISMVAGVELSALWQGRTIHVLGLALAPEAPALAALLAELAGLRELRNRDIAQRLDRARAPGTVALARLAAQPLVTRTHIARELVALGAAADLAQAFKRYLASGRPGSARCAWPELARVVDVIREAGGVSVLAHPLRYALSAGKLRSLVRDFAAAGGTALEVSTGQQSHGQLDTAIGLALRCGLMVSQGSDFHDPDAPWQRPGRLAKLPETVVPVWQRWETRRAARDGALLDA
jgi:3',5'-nucleoside bisphosphate phosphatase